MTQDEAFLAAILDDPGDDTPRLVYADWLEERGDPRGEFIRLQVALAKLLCERDVARALGQQHFNGPCRCRHCVHRHREYDLWREHGTRFAANLPGESPAILPGCVVSAGLGPAIFEYTFRRGFPASITLPVAAFLEHAGELFRSAPLESVTLSDLRPSHGTFHETASTVPASLRGKPFWLWSPPRDNAWANDMVPWPLYRLLDGAIGEWHKQYRTEADAFAALSAAAVTLGRRLAGLPPLTTSLPPPVTSDT